MTPVNALKQTKTECMFQIQDPEARNKFYFPLFNEAGIMSAITPQLKGDLKLSQNQFFSHPMITEDLINTSYSRNIWIVRENGSPWSATGVSAQQTASKMMGSPEDVDLALSPGAFHITRSNQDGGLRSEITAFVPANEDTCEVLIIKITNLSDQTRSAMCVPAIPVYARSADNQRDHRQVTTLLNRLYTIPGGISVKPLMTFDERGHQENEVNYSVQAFDDSGNASDTLYKRLQDFVGPGGSLDAPGAIYGDFLPPKDIFEDGREILVAPQFDCALSPGESKSFVVICGITSTPSAFERWKSRYGTPEDARKQCENTQKYWLEKLHTVYYDTGDDQFDDWMKWVSFQPMARKVFGCSFLPDFGYGRGGRGWRDLWQDCLALLITDPKETIDLLLNNFAGVRVDGSNATIIGANSGEFIADRNNISRTWMDHGVWPFLTLLLYVNQTGDFSILFKPQYYFKDSHAYRSKETDTMWTPAEGNRLKTPSGEQYQGSILEHVIVQVITQFYNVGEHHICLLEGADWNDGLDMASDRGESVAFHCMYRHHLTKISELLEHLRTQLDIKEITLLKEMTPLFDRLSAPIDYTDIEAKKTRLNDYMQSVKHTVSGETTSLQISDLILDLKDKAKFMAQVVLENEYKMLPDGHHFFNGYYDNDGNQVEGMHPKGVRMTLTGQVFPIMSGVAEDAMIDTIYDTVKAYLKDPVFGGYRLNTDFKDMALNLGRAFSFSYGDKENGAFFSHMIVMFMNALYQRGHVHKGYEVFSSLYTMCTTYEHSQIAPGIPEYIDSEGRGAYLYLTGSASWMVLTMITEVFGIKGEWGNLKLHPKLVKAQFNQETITVYSKWQGMPICVHYHNPALADYGNYHIQSVSMNGEVLEQISLGKESTVIPQTVLSDAGRNNDVITISVSLG